MNVTKMQHKTATSGSPFTIGWPSTAIPTFLVGNHGGSSLLPQWTQKPMQVKPSINPRSSIRTSRTCLLLLATLLLLLLIAMGACLANLLWLISINDPIDPVTPLYTANNVVKASGHNPTISGLPISTTTTVKAVVTKATPSFTEVTTDLPSSTESDLTSDSKDSSSDDDGFGELTGSVNGDMSSNGPASSSEDESLIDFFRRFNSTLNESTPVRNASSVPDSLGGEFVEHRPMSNEELEEMSSEFADSSVERDESDRESSTVSTVGSEVIPSDPIANRPQPRFESIAMNRFCSIGGIACAALEQCASRFIVLASVRPNSSESTHNSSRTMIEQTYTIHVQQAIRRSPLLSVALRRSQLHVQLDLSSANDNDMIFSTGQCSASGHQALLEPGRTYLISGRVSGLHAISQNCDLRIDWNHDLSESQQQRLLQQLSSNPSQSNVLQQNC
jgi:hypothetical protein